MWNTRTMRVYLPALSSHLLADDIAERPGFAVVAPAGTDREGIEVLEDDAQTEAALVSLVDLREASGEAPIRLVLAVDAPDRPLTGAGVVETGPIDATWADVAAILADSPEAADDVRAVLDADEQDEADEAVARLWERSLEWFDVSERLALAEDLGLRD